jgi:hypothetical protein
MSTDSAWIDFNPSLQWVTVAFAVKMSSIMIGHFNDHAPPSAIRFL